MMRALILFLALTAPAAAETFTPVDPPAFMGTWASEESGEIINVGPDSPNVWVIHRSDGGRTLYVPDAGATDVGRLEGWTSASDTCTLTALKAEDRLMLRGCGLTGQWNKADE